MRTRLTSEAGERATPARHISRPRVLQSDASRLAQLLEERERELGSLAARLTLAEEIERQRIAQGLHDEIGQSLAVLKMKLAEVRRSAGEAGLADAMSPLIGIVDQVMRSTRSLTFSLSSPILQQLGLAAAMENLLDGLVGQQGMEVEFDSLGTAALSPELSILLHRSFRELLHNVARHARARRVRVELRQLRDRVEVLVEDDGVGFDVARIGLDLEASAGFGLFSIRHSLSHVGGSMNIESSPGMGTRATLTVPLAV